MQKLTKAQKRREKAAAKDAEREARIAAGEQQHAVASSTPAAQVGDVRKRAAVHG